MKKEIVAIYGGTFSPPHLGHVRAAEAMSAALSPDRFMIIVDNLPPHKEIDGGATAEQRLRMALLAFGHIPKVEISDMEIRRGGRSFTAETLTILSGEGRELYFLCGTDMFLSLPTWRDPSVIFEKAVICLVRRESDAQREGEILKAAESYKHTFGARIRIIDAPVTEISSTELREALRFFPETAKKMLPDAVHSYIREQGLWQADAEEVLFSLREGVRGFMSEKRYRHTCGVEEMMHRLAAYFPGEIDPLVLSASALLHDVTKELSESEQRALIEKMKMPLSESQAASPAILHSFTASARIEEAFPFFAREQILRAIRAHTTGAKEMSLLDKLLFVSDYIEPGRMYPRCTEERERFFSEIERGVPPMRVLDLAVLSILESTVSFLKSRGLPLCEDTLAAQKALLSTISSD